jgi:hypothetical protein
MNWKLCYEFFRKLSASNGFEKPFHIAGSGLQKLFSGSTNLQITSAELGSDFTKAVLRYIFLYPRNQENFLLKTLQEALI